MAETVDSRNEVQIDLDKYMRLVDKLDDAEDTIKALKDEAKAAKNQLEPPKRKFVDLFLDDNDINEKSIIGFDHAEIMSRACRLWRFPEVQVTAIRNHHQPDCSEEHLLACLIHLADVLAKSAGFTAMPHERVDQIEPEILAFLDLQQQDLDDLAIAVADDVQKIEEELRLMEGEGYVV